MELKISSDGCSSHKVLVDMTSVVRHKISHRRQVRRSQTVVGTRAMAMSD